MSNIKCYQNDPSKKDWRALFVHSRSKNKSLIGCGKFSDEKLNLELMADDGNALTTFIKVSDIQAIVSLDYIGEQGKAISSPNSDITSGVK